MVFHESDSPTAGKDRGGAAWFKQEVLPLEPQLRGWLRQRYRSIHDTDDLIQETFLRVWRTCAAIPPRQPKAFLFRVARNLALDQVRRQRVAPFVDITTQRVRSITEDVPCAAERASRQQEIHLLDEAIADLPPRRREVLTLRRIQGLSHREAAAKLGLTPRATELLTSRGVKQCREYLIQRGCLPNRA